MSAADEAVVRRFYDEMCNERRNDIAAELFADDHVMHDPQVPAAPGPAGVVDAVSAYQEGVDGHWAIDEIHSAGDRVIVRWTGTGTHIGEMNGLAPTGRPIEVSAISIHRMAGGKIAETHEVWDTLGFLQQLGALPGEATELLSAGYDAFARGDIEGAMQNFDAEIVWVEPETSALGGTFRGPSEVAGFFARMPEVYPELSVQPERYVESGDTVSVLGRISGRTTAGVAFEEPFVHVWTMRDGRAVAFRDFFDTAKMNSILEQQGAGAAVPGQASRTGTASTSRS